ncbi:phosphotransferase [Nocardia sp.]|uniref:phosphotransferase n=1 Tax=Nocardia sp. TaxID=1821 RepID=UPI003451A9E0
MDFSAGWDCLATLVDERWVERRPRRPEVVDQLVRETRSMPWLAPRLPLPVPIPEVLPDARHTTDGRMAVTRRFRFEMACPALSTDSTTSDQDAAPTGVLSLKSLWR